MELLIDLFTTIIYIIVYKCYLIEIVALMVFGNIFLTSFDYFLYFRRQRRKKGG